MALAARLDADATADGVALRFTVRNESDEPVELSFGDAQRAEFVARDGDETVWRYGEGRAFAQVLGTEAIVPDGTLTVECDWPAPPSGTYEIEAALTAADADCAAETRASV